MPSLRAWTLPIETQAGSNSGMDLTDHDLQQFAEADRREVDPPIHPGQHGHVVAWWSPGGHLDWWVKDRQEWPVGYVVRMAGNGGLKLLIFARRFRREARRYLLFDRWCSAQ